MTLAQCLVLLSASSGAIGTFILFQNTYAFEPFSGGTLGGPKNDEWNARVRSETPRRRLWLKVGLGFLGVSFIIQAGSAFLPSPH